MNITVKKGDKELEFKYSTRKSEIQKGTGAKLVFHVWACDDLPTDNNEVFFGAYTDDASATPEQLQERATKAIKAKLNIPDEASAPPQGEPIEDAVIIEEPKTDDNGDLSN